MFNARRGGAMLGIVVSFVIVTAAIIPATIVLS
jgi:hypothetical protein